jgi:TolB-like protein
MTPSRFLTLFILLGLVACAQPAPPGSPPDAAATATVSLSAPPALPPRLVVSVLYFEDRTRAPDLAWLRKGLADMLITDLSQAGGLHVVQRERLEHVFREQALHAGGRVEDRTAVAIGRLTGATVLLQGSATRVGDVLRIDAHLLDVERGTVLGAASVEGGLNEALALEKRLALRILEILRPGAEGRRHPVFDGSLAPSQEAAGAMYEGLDATDRGNVPEALLKFESALKRDPRYGEAQRRYQRTLSGVDTGQLRDRALDRDAALVDRRRLATRLADDLFRDGLHVTVRRGAPAGGAKDGAGTAFQIEIRFDDQALRKLREDVGRLGGSVEQQGSRLLVRASNQAEIHDAFTRAAVLPRRLFLHLMAPDGRRLAAYSRLRRWQGLDWVSLGAANEVVIEAGRSMRDVLVVPGLPDESLFAAAQVRVRFDAVPREQAQIDVELLGINDANREVLLSPRPPARKGQAEAPPEPRQKRADRIRAALQDELTRVWNPLLGDRQPGSGYLPSARRSAIVVAPLRPEGQDLPILADGSGDPAFDTACLSAWTGMDRARVVEALSSPKADVVPLWPLRARVYCDLLKDIPSPD